jgi:hypothetical protein
MSQKETRPKSQADPRKSDAKTEALIQSLGGRGEVAIKNFLLFLFGSLLLIFIALALKNAGLPDSWHLGDPVEKVMSLGDTKPFSALLALTLLMRGFVIYAPGKEPGFVADLIEALYAVAFSSFGFLVGAGAVQLLILHNGKLLLLALVQTVVSFATFLLIDYFFYYLDRTKFKGMPKPVVCLCFIGMSCLTLLSG